MSLKIILAYLPSDRELSWKETKPQCQPRLSLPDGQVALNTEFFKPLEWCTVHTAAHDHDHLVRQLDIWLPAQIATRGTLEHETEIWNKEPRLPPGELSNMKPKSGIKSPD